MGHYQDSYDAQAEQAAYELKVKVDEAVDEAERALRAANRLPRSREASIAITHIETAILWLRK